MENSHQMGDPRNRVFGGMIRLRCDPLPGGTPDQAMSCRRLPPPQGEMNVPVERQTAARISLESNRLASRSGSAICRNAGKDAREEGGTGTAFPPCRAERSWREFATA